MVLRAAARLALVATLCGALVAPRSAVRRRSTRRAVDDDDAAELARLDAAAEQARARAEAQPVDEADGARLRRESTAEAYFWDCVAGGRYVRSGGADFPRGPALDPARADAAAALRRGVLDLPRAGEIRWAQSEDLVCCFAAVDDGVRAADVSATGRETRATVPTSKAPHSFRLIFGRAIIPRSALDAWMLFLERARAEHSTSKRRRIAPPRSVTVGTRALSVTIGGAPVLVDAPLRHEVDADGSGWFLEVIEGLDRRHVVVELPKLNDALVWASLLDGRTDRQVIESLEDSIAATEDLERGPATEDPRNRW